VDHVIALHSLHVCELAMMGMNYGYEGYEGVTLGHMHPCRGLPVSRDAMRLSAYFSERLHGTLSWTHVHV